MQVIVHASGLPGGAGTVIPLRLAEYGALDEITFSTAWGDLIGGDDQASWQIALHNLAIRGLIARGDRVTIWDGGTKVWGGTFNSAVPNEDGVLTMTARGRGYALRRFLALDQTDATTYKPTTNPHQAVVDAMARGLHLDAYPASDLSTAAYSATEESQGITTVADLLVASLRESQKRAVVRDGILSIEDDPTSPTLRYDAAGAVLGASDAETTSVVWVRYQKTAPSSGDPVTAANLALASWPPNPATKDSEAETAYDVTDQGLITDLRATNIAKGMYEQVVGKSGIAGSLEFTDGDGRLQAIDGGSARLSIVRAGQMLRVTRARSALVDLMPQKSSDIILGSTEFKQAEGKRTLTVTALEPAVLTLAQVIARAMATDVSWRRRQSEVPA